MHTKTRFVYFPLMIMAFMSCHRDEPVLPIEKQKLVDVLADVHLAEMAVREVTGTAKDSTANLYYNRICQIYHIRRSDLDSSIALLSRQPELLLEVYSLVREKLEQTQEAGHE